MIVLQNRPEVQVKHTEENWDHPLSTYAKFFEKLTFLTP